MRKEDKTQEKLNKLENTIGKFSEVSLDKNVASKKPTFSTGEVVCLLIITLFVSLLMGGIVTYKFCTSRGELLDAKLQEFINNYEYIVDNYYEDVDKEELMDAALDGMLGALDKNSIYLEETASDNFNKQLDGSYEGFGIEIYNDKEGNIVIYNVYDNTSAASEGLKAGDIITKFEQKPLANTATNEFVNMVSKANSKKINITYKRDGQEKEITLVKKKVTLPSVTSKIIDKENKIGYIRVSIFAENTDEQFQEELKKIEKNKIKSLIIDLRSNSGGHLSSAENMISQFVDSSHVIYQIKIKDKITKHYSNGHKNKDYNIAILVDNSSASASEILTSALKEQYNATIIGKKTYGKGTVQELQNLPNGDKYKFTTKEWLTSKGKKVNGVGIEPDIDVNLDEKYNEAPTEANDNQLQEALKFLQSKSHN